MLQQGTVRKRSPPYPLVAAHDQLGGLFALAQLIYCVADDIKIGLRLLQRC